MRHVEVGCTAALVRTYAYVHLRVGQSAAPRALPRWNAKHVLVAQHQVKSFCRLVFRLWVLLFESIAPWPQVCAICGASFIVPNIHVVVFVSGATRTPKLLFILKCNDAKCGIRVKELCTAHGGWGWNQGPPAQQ